MSEIIKLVISFLAWIARRPRIRVRVSADDPDDPMGGLRFEVENVSQTSCSLEPVVETEFLFPSRGRMTSGVAIFDVRELDRELPPYKAKIFTATGRQLPPAYGHGWFRVYVFRPTRGVARKLRIRNAMLEAVGLFRFSWEKWIFKLSGHLPGPTSITHSAYEALKRSQGPH